MNIAMVIGIIIVIIIIVSLVVLMWPASLPVGLQNGDVVRCSSDGAIYKLENYKKRHYPNYPNYMSYGSPPYKPWDCNDLAKISNGPDM